LGAFLLNVRKFPSELKATEADAAQGHAQADSTDIDSLGKIYSMYKALTVDIAEVLERERKNKIIQLDHEEQILSLSAQLKAALASGASAEARADSAENAVASLQQQVKDYPADVHHLEDIIKQMQEVIDELKAEITRLQTVALANATARQTEADTASTLANTAAHAAAPQQPPDLKDDAAQDRNVSVKIVGELLDPKV
jgi:chromosome segregation ATPase